MSKIVCDVCGSTYSETEAQCPICGTAKSEAAKPVVETNAEDQAAKGGKFSRSNTRRNGTGSTRRTGAEKNKEEGNPSNVAMIIIVAVLLLAIVSVCVFIAVRLVNRPDQPDPSGSSDSTPPIVQTVPCTGIELVGNPDNALLFTDLTQTAQLNVKAKPENTTDTVTYTYTSSDPSVVTVDASGLVTPVAEGTATVTVAYGSYTITVTVTCELPKPEVKLELVKRGAYNPTLAASALGIEGLSGDEAALADRVVVMNGGQIELEGTPKEVFSQVDRIKKIGLDVPQPTELAYKLKKQGIELGNDILTIDECVNAILAKKDVIV